MYDFPEVHTSTMQIVDALAISLNAIGLEAHAEVPIASVHADLIRHWLRVVGSSSVLSLTPIVCVRACATLRASIEAQ